MAFLPVEVPELIEMLDKEYPNQCIKKGESFEDAIRRAGRRDVVEFLIGLHEDTTRKALAQQQKIVNV